jgi:MerR family transcriptional regulator, thiopeptide resistance regulator
MYTVKQLSKMAGVTARTLHYYDEIGLLKPGRIGENGYRYYSDESLLQLQQILLYREMDLPLDQIKHILQTRDFDLIHSLETHRYELKRKIIHLEELIATVDHTIEHLKGNKNMEPQKLFSGFSEEQQAEYEKEAMNLYDPKTVKESNQRWRKYSAEKKQQILDEGNLVYEAFLKAMPAGPASSEAQECVARWRSHIENFWSPRDEQLLGLADLYNDDPRFKKNYDRLDPNLAAFVREAVKVYVGRRG